MILEDEDLSWCDCPRCLPIVRGAIALFGYLEAKQQWERGTLYAWYCPQHDPNRRNTALTRTEL